MFSLIVTKKQMNVNENLLQLALIESQDTNMYKLSFDSNIIWKISHRSSIMTVTCNRYRKGTLESNTKQVNNDKNKNVIFEENVITQQIKSKTKIKLTYITKFSYFIFPFILSSMGKIWLRKNFTDILFQWLMLDRNH